MASPMTYLDFVDSLKQNKIHFVSGQSKVIKGFGVANEPFYALETSGSVRSKLYLHSLNSVEGACAAFLRNFKMSDTDKWGLCLSTSHVAGFSVLARSHFGNLQNPHFFEWSKDNLVSEVEKNKITILSLVPTQIFDLVKMGCMSPVCVRMVFVGGAKLSKDLREEAVNLGWPIVECYGATETFAQMSYSIAGEGLKPFDGWHVKTEEDEVFVKGPGLFEGLVKEGIFRSRNSEWFATGDLGSFDGEILTVLGKKEGLVKIKGSYFDFNNLKSHFLNFLIEERIDPSTCFLSCIKEERDGAGVYLISTSNKIDSKILSTFKEIKGVFYLDAVDRSALSKVKVSSLSNALKKTVLSL